MTRLLIAICTLLTTTAFAQQTATWKGGTPGKENVWNEARNWSNNKVPNEFTDVLIEDVSTSTFSAPVIESGTIELNSIWMTSNAQLTIEATANLVVYGYTEGLLKENLKVKGNLIVMGEIIDPAFENLVNNYPK